jgi:hypothetical protein
MNAYRTKLNLKKALPLDGRFFHARYCAHIINLIVCSGLKKIDSPLKKI